MKRLLIMGPPGAGKGTQAVKIVDAYGVCHISTGDMFRAAMQQGTEMGMIAKGYVDRGELVPDEVTVEIVRERLMKQDVQDHGFLLDGFPRNLKQAQALDIILKDLAYDLDAVINIDVDGEILITRVISRRICPKCKATYNLLFNPPHVDGICDVCGIKLITRKDDTRETIANRIDIYHSQTQPLLNYYEEQNLLVNVNGTGKVDQIFQDIRSKLGE